MLVMKAKLAFWVLLAELFLSDFVRPPSQVLSHLPLQLVAGVT